MVQIMRGEGTETRGRLTVEKLDPGYIVVWFAFVVDGLAVVLPESLVENLTCCSVPSCLCSSANTSGCHGQEGSEGNDRFHIVPVYLSDTVV
jgi:hypothetical protein